MGSVAGEVKDGRKTYITGISIGLPLNVRSTTCSPTT
jgi:hypothetical protein